MKLGTYLSERRMTDREFAEKIGRERSRVTRYRQGKATPSFATITAIHNATRGKVSYRDFVEEENQ